MNFFLLKEYLYSLRALEMWLSFDKKIAFVWDRKGILAFMEMDKKDLQFYIKLVKSYSQNDVK